MVVGVREDGQSVGEVLFALATLSIRRRQRDLGLTEADTRS
jgi:hypothetical protein